MDSRLKRKIERELQQRAMEAFAAVSNESPVHCEDVYKWFLHSTAAVSKLQMAVNNAAEVVIKDRKK